MSRYISEMEFLLSLAKKPRYSSKTIGEALDEAPSIDIVRCKECMWSKANGAYQWCGRLDSTARITDDDFCSYGERREE